MQTTITARHFTANPALRQYASARLSKLEKYYDGITDVHVVLHKNSLTKTAEITLRVYRQRLRGCFGFYLGAAHAVFRPIKARLLGP